MRIRDGWSALKVYSARASSKVRPSHARAKGEWLAGELANGIHIHMGGGRSLFAMSR